VIVDEPEDLIGLSPPTNLELICAQHSYRLVSASQNLKVHVRSGPKFSFCSFEFFSEFLGHSQKRGSFYFVLGIHYDCVNITALGSYN